MSPPTVAPCARPCACARRGRRGNRRSWSSHGFPSGTGTQADQEAVRAQRLDFRRRRKGDVQRGNAEPLRQTDRRGRERTEGRLGRVRADQKPPAGDRRERNGRLQLGVISPAGPLIGLRPAPVKDVLAIGVALQVQRHRRQQSRRRRKAPGDAAAIPFSRKPIPSIPAPRGTHDR